MAVGAFGGASGGGSVTLLGALGGTGGGGRWVPLVGLAAAAVVPPSWVSLAGTITLTRI